MMWVGQFKASSMCETELGQAAQIMFCVGQEEEKLVQEVCRIMLFRERLKPGVPVAHADLIKNVPV